MSSDRALSVWVVDDDESVRWVLEQALTQAEAKLEDIEAQQEDIIKGYVQAGEAEKARIIDDAHKSAARIKEMADLTISQEIKHARAELMDELAEMSAKLAEDMKEDNAKLLAILQQTRDEIMENSKSGGSATEDGNIIKVHVGYKTPIVTRCFRASRTCGMSPSI